MDHTILFGLNNPSNVLISGPKRCGKATLAQYIATSMDNSDIWLSMNNKETLSKYPDNCHLIVNFQEFIDNIVTKKYVSDCSLVIIDNPSVKHCYIQKILEISKEYDIMVVIVNNSNLRNNNHILRYIEFECVFNGLKLDNIPFCDNERINTEIIDSYKQITDNEFVVVNKHSNIYYRVYISE